MVVASRIVTPSPSRRRRRRRRRRRLRVSLAVNPTHPSAGARMICFVGPAAEFNLHTSIGVIAVLGRTNTDVLASAD